MKDCSIQPEPTHRREKLMYCCQPAEIMIKSGKCARIFSNNNRELTRKMNKELSIIVTSYKNPSVLRLCLEALKKNVLCENFEILVLDSATEEDTETLVREEFPEIRFFPHEKNIGFARLVN